MDFKNIVKDLEDKAYLKTIDFKNNAKALINKCNGFLEATEKYEALIKNVFIEFMGKYSSVEQDIRAEVEAEYKNREAGLIEEYEAKLANLKTKATKKKKNVKKRFLLRNKDFYMAGPTKIKEGQIVDADNLSETEAASTAAGDSGASMIGLEDAGSHWTSTEIEALSQEIAAEKVWKRTGTSDPTGVVTPKQVSDVFIDETNDKVYIAYGTANTDWQEVGAGGGGGTNFASTTFTSQTSVSFAHNLGTKPLIQILNSSDEYITPDTLNHDNDNQVTVTFLTSETGTILAAGGSGSANQVNWTHSQTSAATTWNFTHNLGSKGTFSIYNSSGEQIEPDTVTATTTAFTATFGSAQTGSVELVAGIGNSNASVTYEALNSNSDVGDQDDQVAKGDHGHIPLPQGGMVSNLGISVSGSTVTLTDKDGGTLSSTNKAHFYWPVDKDNLGRSKELSLAAPKSFTFGASANLSGQNWHMTTAVAWGNSFPLFIYASYDTSDNIEIFLTPDPTRMKTPSSTARIGYHGNPSTQNDQSDFWAWNATDIRSNFSSERPCILIGSLLGTKDASDDWTISALNHERTGIGRFPWATNFVMPAGQNGASSGKYMTDFGSPSTVPEFTTNQYYYNIHPDGWCTLMLNFSGDGGDDGSTANLIRFRTPYAENASITDFRTPAGHVVYSGGSIGSEWVALFSNSSYFNITTHAVTSGQLDAAIQTLTLQDFPSGNRSIHGVFRFKAFNA